MMTRRLSKLADQPSGQAQLKQKVETNSEPRALLLGLREAMRNAQG